MGRVWAARAMIEISVTIQKRPYRKSPWRARFRAPDGRERSRSFARRIDAERWLRDQQTAVDRGAWADPRRGRIRFGDWAEQVMATRPDLRPSTIARDDIVMRRLVLPTFSSRTLGSIRASDLRSWLTDMAGEGYSSSYRAKVAHAT